MIDDVLQNTQKNRKEGTQIYLRSSAHKRSLTNLTKNAGILMKASMMTSQDYRYS